MGKRESAFPFGSIRPSFRMGKFASACEFGYFGSPLGRAKGKVLSLLAPSDRRHGWANAKVLSFLLPTDLSDYNTAPGASFSPGRRYERQPCWANRKVLSDLIVRSGKFASACEFDLRIVAKGKVLSLLDHPDHSLHHEQLFTRLKRAPIDK